MQPNINMNQMPNAGLPPMQPQQPTPPKEEKGGMGPLIGSIIVIIILVIGAIYFWGGMLNKQENIVPDQQPAALSLSDDVGDLEQDLMNTPDIQVDIENI